MGTYDNGTRSARVLDSFNPAGRVADTSEQARHGAGFVLRQPGSAWTLGASKSAPEFEMGI